MPTDSEVVIPTPKGVKKFIDELLEEKTRLKHILTARHIKFSPIDEIAKLKQALKREHVWVLHYKKLWEDTFIDKDPELEDKPRDLGINENTLQMRQDIQRSKA
jgi:hypothetical protein